jgi:hypothetical protein
VLFHSIKGHDDDVTTLLVKRKSRLDKVHRIPPN